MSNKPIYIQTQGHSMFPLLLDGDIVYSSKIWFHKIKINDILVMSISNKFVVHRVIYKTSRYVITKGDNNRLSDKKIYPRQIIGKLLYIKRNSKKIYPEELYLLQSVLYTKEIHKLHKMLEKNRIHYIFLKGLPLHVYYEKTHPKRLYADCDILVPQERMKQTVSLLSKQGYQRANRDLSEVQKRFNTKIVEESYIKNVNGFPVEFDVHAEPVFLMTQLGSLNLLYPEDLVAKIRSEFLNNSRKVTIRGQMRPILSGRHLVVYLALHFFHHNHRGMFRLSFLDTVIRKESKKKSFSWYEIEKFIKKYKLESYLYITLFMLKKYYNTPIPFSLTMQCYPTHRVNARYINNLKNTIPFDGQSRSEAGIERFKNILYLSPHPLFKRFLIFFNPHVIYLLLLVGFFYTKNKLTLLTKAA